jgi:hypothetical protein
MLIPAWTANTLGDLKSRINDIATAQFVLAGSLHAAVIACAYGVPFAFWDTGHLDLPFKWRDLAASLNIPVCFVSNLRDGERVYDVFIKGRVKKPLLSPILANAPYGIKPEFIERAARLDEETIAAT